MTRAALAFWCKVAMLLGSLCDVSRGETVLLDFTAEWCAPCQQMQATIDQLRAEGLPINQIDVDRNPNMVAKYRVSKLPHFVAVKDGAEFSYLTGATSAATLRGMLHQAGYRLPLVAGPEVSVPVRDSHFQAVCRVRTQDRNGEGSLASGTLVEVNQTQGLVLTNHHVIKDAITGAITVTFRDGDARYYSYPATVLASDADADIAALLIARPKVQPVTVDESDAVPQPGERLYIAGYGGATDEFRAYGGPCTGSGKFVKPQLEVNAVARQGDSGGPILNTSGKLVGCLWGSDPARGVTVGCQCGPVRRLLARVRDRFRQRRQPATKPRLAPAPLYPQSKPTTFAPAPGPVEYQAPADETQTTPGPTDDEPAAEPAAEEPVEQDQPAVESPPPRKPVREKIDEAKTKIVDVVAGVGARESPTKTPLDAAVQGVAAKGFAAVLTPWLGPFAGIAGSLAAGVFGALWLRARGKLKKRLQGGEEAAPAVVTKTIRMPSPPAADVIEERHHNHFIRVPESKTDEAWAMAHEIYANYYPGTFNTLKAVEKLKEQILKGEPHGYNATRHGAS